MKRKNLFINLVLILLWLANFAITPMQVASASSQDEPVSNQSASQLSMAERSSIQELLRKAEYFYSWSDSQSAYTASNVNQAIHTFISADGLRLAPISSADSTAWTWQLSLSKWGVEGKLQSLAGKPGIQFNQDRVSLDWSRTLQEWFVNDSRGLEHGFTIQSAPGDGQLVIELDLQTNLQPSLSENGASILARNPLDSTAVKYADLVVEDAAGRRLPSSLNLSACSNNAGLSSCTVQLVFDPAGAVYPITVDPLITTQVQTLVAADAASGDFFGSAVAASEDIVVIGAYGADIGANTDQGAAYLFLRNQGGAEGWGQVVKLTAADGAANDAFGYSVAIDGDQVLIGAYQNASKGAAYVFKRNQGGANNWGQVAKLTASDGAASDAFGHTVAIQNGQAIVGAPGNGSAYIFYRNQGGADHWGQVQKLLPSVEAPGFGVSVAISDGRALVGADQAQIAFLFEQNTGGSDAWGESVQIVTVEGEDPTIGFGAVVAISGDALVVGAPQTTFHGSVEQGVAFIFERNQEEADDWIQLRKLNAPDGVNGIQFGHAVSIDRDQVIVGSLYSDAAYLFDRNQGGPSYWQILTVLKTASDIPADEYGTAVSVRGTTVVVGSYGYDGASTTDQGAAYVYNRNGATWLQTAKPIPSDGATNDYFGTAVALYDDTLIVGSPNADVAGAANQGAAYIYLRNQSNPDTWGNAIKLTASDGLAEDNFGKSVAVYGDMVVVGAPAADPAGVPNRGAVYLFERNQGGMNAWGLVTKIVPASALEEDGFGSSVSLYQNTLAVGAYADDLAGGVDQGSVYLFSRNQGGTNAWGQLLQLSDASGEANDRFGYSISLNEHTLAVGACLSVESSPSDSSAIFIYSQNQTGADAWGLVKKITNANPDLNKSFGCAVSLHQDRLAIGAPGATVATKPNQGEAFVHYRNQGGAEQWGQVAEVIAPTGAAQDKMGSSVAINENFLLAGAPGSTVGSTTNMGRVFLFARNQGGADLWGHTNTFNNNTGTTDEFYGKSVSVDRTTFAIGAPGINYSGRQDQGVAYVYRLTQLYTLTVSKIGTGTGTVNSLPFGITCGTDCTQDYEYGTRVNLSATADPGMVFNGWSAECTPTSETTCVIRIGQASTVTASFEIARTLNVTKSGAGTGTITSTPPGINCGTDCTQDFPLNGVITLTATPGYGMMLTGWSENCTPTGDLTCEVTLDDNKTVDASFEKIPTNLIVTKDGDGTGKVTSDPIGIDCGSDCEEPFGYGYFITLTATPDPGSVLTGWSGNCTVAGPLTCQISINGINTVNATFKLAYTLSVTKDGSGTGLVTSSPAGINCGTDCSEGYAIGTVVTLTAAPEANSDFTGWSGNCVSTGDLTCEATVDQAKTVTATFTLKPSDLTVTKDGSGSGLVTSDPVGIDCGLDCSESYTYGTLVTLTAAADPGSVFTGWSENCTSTSPTTCQVTMDAAKTVNATFNLAVTLSVTKDGSGGGTVTSDPAGIDCGSDCSEDFASGTLVTLTASPDPNSSFTAWSANCTSTGDLTCETTMDESKTVTATFTILPNTLGVVKDGTGSGTVTSDPPGIDCGSDCSETYTPGTLVTLTAAPAAGSTFSGWSGNCTSTGTFTCQVTLDVAKTVTATFSLIPYTLTVTKDGSGSGTVTSSPVGIDCGSDCTENFNYGTVVTLTAAPAAGSAFAGWSGNCTSTGALTCQVTIDQAKTVNATFNLATYLLTVAKDGNGSGTVTSNPAGIDCGSDCSESYAYGTLVTLTAAPATGSTFSGWSGNCTPTGTFTCQVTVDQAKTVTANFTLIPYTLTVSKGGTGSGTVTSSPVGIDCGSDCSESYNYGTLVTLTAAPATGSSFISWSGNCTSTGAFTCQVTVDQAKTVTATFTLIPYTLTVAKDGNGSGTVTSSPVGIDCGSDCSESYAFGTIVVLTAAPATGSTFNGWSGNCTSTGEFTCQVTVDQAKTVTATFTLIPYTLTIIKEGTGSGTVTSNPAGVDCGSDCSESYNYGTVVTLTAAPATGSTFSGWSGNCTSTGAFTCQVTVDQAKTVNATFTLNSYTLTVAKDGSGSGSVTSSPVGIDCGSDCSESYAFGTIVTLTAAPASGSTFSGWSGNCTSTGAFTCQVTIDQAKTVTATFTLVPYTLTVTKDGTGSGTVTSSPVGIDCGSDCSESYPNGTVVTLTAAPAIGSAFSGWSGNCTSTGALTCQVTVDQAKTVNATFSLITYTLTVAKDGSGSGTVTSSPAGIDCGLDCSENYAYGTIVTLTAAPSDGSSFNGWSGNCTSTGAFTCQVTVDQAKTVTATFTLLPYTLTVSKDGSGTGTVTSNPAGIDCGTDCSETYPNGTLVTLTAAPATGSIFSGWSGNCTSTGEFTCQVTIDQSKTVNATFTLITHVLTVSKSGNGSGTVTSSPAGIDCGSDCSESYAYGTIVTLTAAPATGSSFNGWSGNCTPTGAFTCQVTIDQAKTVTATFTLNTFQLTVSLLGSGTGVVTSSPAGIDCGSDCSEFYNYNTLVTLTAVPQPGNGFSGWSGNCTPTSAFTCQVTITSAVEVTATYITYKIYMPFTKK